MAQVNPLTRELLVKLVYYGPGLGGKTTSLQCIHAASPAETRGQIVSLATPVDRTLYFDFLPIRTTTVRGHKLRLQLFTVPGQVYFNATRKLVLTGADGVVFVADSQYERHDANLESLENLATNLGEQGRALAELPLVIQYNKRDIPGVMDVDEMDAGLNEFGAPSFPTAASSGDGVLAALDRLVVEVVQDLERRNALGKPVEERPEPRFARAEEALEDQIGRASEEIWLGASDTDATDAIDAHMEATDRGTPSIATQRDEAAAALARVEREALDTEPPAAPVAASMPPVSPMPSVPLTRPRTVSASDVPASRPLSVPPAPKSYTWAGLFPGDEGDVLQIEMALAGNDPARAIEVVDALACRIMVGVAQQAGLPEASHQPALVVPLLGIDGPRWMAHRRLVRRAASGGPLDQKDALRAFALLIDIRLRRDALL